LFLTNPEKLPNQMRSKTSQSRKNYQKNKSSNLLLSWESNLNELKSSGLLPTNKWSDITKVRVILLDENLHPYFQSLKPPIKTRKTGHYILEVSFMSHEADTDKEVKKTGIITQYNLIDITSEEMVWEYSSTFYTDLFKN